MTLTKRTVSKLLAPGDTVYIITPGGAIPSKVLAVCEDSLYTEEDLLFYDEHGAVWMFTRREAEKMALKSQRNVLH